MSAHLVRALTAFYGKAVELTVKLDKRVLGGIRLELDGVQLDGTVRSRLETLSHRIENTVL